MRRLGSAGSVTGLAAAILLTFALAPPANHASAEGSRVDRLVDDYGGSFSPDGKTIVFTRVVSTSRRGIDTHPVAQRSTLLLMRANGSRKRALRHPGARFEEDASFSPDGLSILFVRDKRIFLMRRSGSGARIVRRDRLEQACPRFSPDGRMISLWRGRGRSGAYFVMNADGTALRRLAGSRGEWIPWGCPSWFPDGKRLVFAQDHMLHVASLNGPATRITDRNDGTLYRPAVSPDGEWIACDGSLERGRHVGQGIVLMRANGTAIRRITTFTQELEPDAGPSWSPDGRRIVFSAYRGRLDGAGVYVVARDGTRLRRLSNFVG